MNQISNNKACIVGMGELVWDLFPEGKRLGGAPANFTYIAQQLAGQQADCYLVSSIGADALGDELSRHLQKLGLKQDYIDIDPLYKTGTVNVSFDSEYMPDYVISAAAAWDFIGTQPKVLAEKCDVFCFGSLGQREMTSQKSIHAFLQQMPKSSLRIFDINLRQHFYNKEIILASLKQANVLKINHEELHVLAPLLNIQGSVEAILQQIRIIFHLQLLIFTRGENGSLLVTDKTMSEHSGYSVTVADSVGAGDAFTAAVAIALLQELPLQQLNDLANRIAAYVCTQSGATPLLPVELTSLFQH